MNIQILSWRPVRGPTAQPSCGLQRQNRHLRIDCTPETTAARLASRPYPAHSRSVESRDPPSWHQKVQ